MIWRSGSQIVAQLVMWASTFLVIRILEPEDYGLFAMTGVVLAFLGLMNGWGLASAIVQKAEVSARDIRQMFGMLIAVNLALAGAQLLLAPIAAAYFREPRVEALLQVQALLYLTTPFIALPYALLARRMDYRLQGFVNIAAALLAALTALGGALAGWGVWTLVFAPMVLFATRAVGFTIGARSLVWPSFDFRGAHALAGFGGAMALTQFFQFLLSQADIFIAGRAFDAHTLGLYTTALFLAQIFLNKIVPPLNEVAFSAFSRIRHDKALASAAFIRATRMVMLLALPFFLGLAAVAEPLVHVVLGAKWLEAAPIVRLLALAMPFMTLQALMVPATDAHGHPEIAARNALNGALLLPLAYLVGVHWGIEGLAAAWIVAMPLYFLISANRSLPVIEVSGGDFARALAPVAAAATAMALGVALLDRALPAMPDLPRLAALVLAGGALYLALLFALARTAIGELIAVIRNRSPAS
ncbi:lipopolysaccharide biosynthesis protein [Sphingomonas gilva]|uniref:lipopolysaccharide biosynthesis protein n=1 Tax=Sphingomonas gilva TaxID=2305907 RepID=UPI0026C2AB75